MQERSSSSPSLGNIVAFAAIFLAAMVIYPMIMAKINPPPPQVANGPAANEKADEKKDDKAAEKKNEAEKNRAAKNSPSQAMNRSIRRFRPTLPSRTPRRSPCCPPRRTTMSAAGSPWARSIPT